MSIEAIIESTDKLLGKLEDKTIDDLSKTLDRAFSALERKFEKSYTKALQGKDQTSVGIRLKILTEEISQVLSIINPDNREFYEGRLKALLEMASQYGIDFSSQALAEYGEKDIITTGINLEAIAFVAQNSYDRLKNHAESFRLQAINIIGYNLTIGSGVKKTSAELQNLLGITKGRAETIVRTETLAALNQAAKNNYKENKIELVQLFATADDRTCRYCGARNQSIYEIDDIEVPLHPKCRCYCVAAKMEWIDKGLIDKEWSKNYYNEVPSTKDFGLAPFERLSGRKSPPTPIWKP